MPTNPRLGAVLVPRDEPSDEDYPRLTAEQRGIWHDIRVHCERNRRIAELRGDADARPEMTASLGQLAVLCNVQPTKGARQRVARTLAFLASERVGWIETDSADRTRTEPGQEADSSRTVRGQCLTRIRLTKSGRWQDLDWYRGQFADRGRTEGGQNADKSRTDVGFVERARARSKSKSISKSEEQTSLALGSRADLTEQCAALTASILAHSPRHPEFADEARLRRAHAGWLPDLDKLQRIDEVSHERVMAVLRWLKGDAFWRKNILSAAKLRKQFGRLEGDASGSRGSVGVASADDWGADDAELLRGGGFGD